MIVKLLFDLLIGLFDFFLSLIPTIDFNLTLPDTTYFRQILGAINWVFPMETFLQAIVIWFMVQNTQFGLKIFNFLWKKIPFLG